ncbi:hypothetical protein CAPTEDRAFT_220102 [Capitella teleta]|uniref:Uncharacterized protein n=1 Tax=Capitella teleta TaxID=283909 RepID=R7UIZ9_CAPTE|nr:hypothetical protein CAPTEDRAFT_220102 [Capitella teleta]|eukprot:ELU06165.1 hypothetical protein CAPTEDRAFT_220102 [Capitella teleta]
MACQFQLSEAQPGVWNIQFSSNKRAHNISFTVESKAADPSSGAVSASTIWADDSPQDIDPTKATRKPQKVFAKVQKGNSPVLNADAHVIVSRPNAAAYSIKLKDNGAGADSHANDGIYSANFISFSGEGRYSAQAYIEGSDSTTVNEKTVVGVGERDVGKNGTGMKSTGRFRRAAIGQSFRVVKYTSGPGGKNFPPDRIKDLIVTDYDQDQFTVTLEWTAVGAEADVGTATKYDLRYGSNGAEVRKSFRNMQVVTPEMIINGANLSNPQPADSKEVFKIRLSSDQDYYSFGVVAIDKVKRTSRGEVSNIAAVAFVIREPPPNRTIIYVIIGVASVLFVGIIVAGIVAFIRCHPTPTLETINPAYDLSYQAEMPPPLEASPPPSPPAHLRAERARECFHLSRGNQRILTERSEDQDAIREYWRSGVRREQRTGEQAHPSLSDSKYLEGTDLLHFLLETQAAPHPCF